MVLAEARGRNLALPLHDFGVHWTGPEKLSNGHQPLTDSPDKCNNCSSYPP